MRSIWRHGALGITGLLLLTTGCGSNEEESDTPPGLLPLEASPDQEAPPRAPGSALDLCLERATQEDWNAALDPCTRAARDHPDNPDVQEALQRALEARDQQDFVEE